MISLESTLEGFHHWILCFCCCFEITKNYVPPLVSKELFQPFGDRLDCRLEKDEKVLFIDIADVEDLIYWHEVWKSPMFSVGA